VPLAVSVSTLVSPPILSSPPQLFAPLVRSHLAQFPDCAASVATGIAVEVELGPESRLLPEMLGEDVPPGLNLFVPAYPALKRWAKLGCPCGADCLLVPRPTSLLNFGLTACSASWRLLG
jgi:hypothetical protein